MEDLRWKLRQPLLQELSRMPPCPPDEGSLYEGSSYIWTQEYDNWFWKVQELGKILDRQLEALARTDDAILQQEYRKEIKEQATIKNDLKKWAVTISPQQREDIKDSLKIIDILKTLSLAHIRPLVGTIEQTSSTEDFCGFHIHAVIETKYEFYDLKDKFSRAFNGKRKPKANICLRPIYNDNWEKNYMQGDKHNDEKDPKARMDILMRQKYNIPLCIDLTSNGSKENNET